jgi:hypothetical protein
MKIELLNSGTDFFLTSQGLMICYDVFCSCGRENISTEKIDGDFEATYYLPAVSFKHDNDGFSGPVDVDTGNRVCRNI